MVSAMPVKVVGKSLDARWRQIATIGGETELN